MTATMSSSKLHELLGSDADALLSYSAKGFAKDKLHLPGPDFIDRVVAASDRSVNVLRNFQLLLNTGRALQGERRRAPRVCPRSSPSRPGHRRALRRRVVRPEPDLL